MTGPINIDAKPTRLQIGRVTVNCLVTKDGYYLLSKQQLEGVVKQLKDAERVYWKDMLECNGVDPAGLFDDRE